jgi:hypothetical protein
LNVLIRWLIRGYSCSFAGVVCFVGPNAGCGSGAALLALMCKVESTASSWARGGLPGLPAIMGGLGEDPDPRFVSVLAKVSYQCLPTCVNSSSIEKARPSGAPAVRRWAHLSAGDSSL